MDQLNLLLSQLTDFLVSGLLWFLITLGILGVLGVLGTAFFLWYKWRKREERALDYVLLQVLLPRDNEIKIDAMEQVFNALYSLKKGGRLGFLHPQEHLTLEIVGQKESLKFYICVPENLRDMVEKQIFGSYPMAEIRKTDEYNIFSKDGKVAFGSYQLRSSNYYPIKVYKDLAVDPISAITSALGKMGDGEGAVVQILLSPAENKWKSLGKKLIGAARRSAGGGAEGDKDAGPKLDPRTIEAIETKCAKPGFNAVVRLVTCSSTMEGAKAHLANLKACLEQFNSEWNGFKKQKTWLKHSFMMDFIYRYQPIFKHNAVLNSEELATIFHFPNKTIETPNIDWINARRGPAPMEIPDHGLYVGKSFFRGMEKPIYIQEGEDRRRHTYIVGKSGVGKSWLLRKMIIQDIKAGHGVCFIDPHDTYEQVLQMIPPERAEDVIYFDPSHTDRPMGLNMVEAYNEEQMHMITGSIIGLMYKLFDPHQTGIVGPRFEHQVRNTLLTVLQAIPGGTLVEVVRCMQDPTFVQELLPRITDPMIRRYWTDQIAHTAEFHKSETLDYVVSKFGRFVTNKTIRNIIGQPKSAFNFREVMDKGKILIINLAKGSLGEENSAFLGLIIIPKILAAAMSRQDTPVDERRDFYLYVDEFQNFATPDFATILSEARKYHLNLTVANQFVGQMEEDVKNAVFGNVGTLCAFQTGPADAGFLAHYFQPTFGEADIINIEARNCYMRTIVNGQPTIPFSVNVSEDVAEIKRQCNPRVSEMIKELSFLRYGRAKDEVEAEIARRAKL